MFHPRSRSCLRLGTPAAGALVWLLSLPSASHALKPVDRQDWVATVGVGVGRADVDLNNDELQTGWTRGASPEFRFGRMIGRHLMVAVGDRQWLDEGGIEDYKIRANIQNFNLLVTVYPGRSDNWTSGFYLQAGAGPAHARVSALEPFEGGANEWGETYEVVAKEDENGLGMSASLGYEFRISSHLAAGIGFSYNYLDFDDELIFDQAKFYPGGVSLSWYF